MNKTKSPICQNQNQDLGTNPALNINKILSPRDSFNAEFKIDSGVLTPERIEKEIESTLIRDLETLVRRLSKMDFS